MLEYLWQLWQTNMKPQRSEWEVCPDTYMGFWCIAGGTRQSRDSPQQEHTGSGVHVIPRSWQGAGELEGTRLPKVAGLDQQVERNLRHHCYYNPLWPSW